jgi:hypothetical protein
MTYTKTSWVDATPITATAFNHFETQYGQAYSDFLYNHNHDTRYFTKTISDSTFYWSVFMGHNSGADGDTLDTHYASEIIGKSLPVGAIVMWGHDSGDIPAGWHICDGSVVGAETVADLRNMFVVGAGSTYSVGASLGSATVTPIVSTIDVAVHVMTSDELPAHSHSYTDYWNEGSIISYYKDATEANRAHSVINDDTTKSTSSDGGKASPDGHDHDSGSSGTYNSEANIPPYWALYYIQRVS